MRLFEGDFGERLSGAANDAVLSVVGVGDACDRSLFHVAGDAVVGLLAALFGGSGAALLGVAGEAFAAIVGDFVLWRGRLVDDVTGDAGQASVSLLIAAA